jgi:amidohydrolase
VGVRLMARTALHALSADAGAPPPGPRPHPGRPEQGKRR